MLIVDDTPENLVVLRLLLEDDFDVQVAGGGVEALKIIDEAAEPFDLVVTDQRMPDVTGVELLASLKERFPSTLGIVVTAYTDVEPMTRAINLGEVHHFIFKPWDSREMFAAVREALSLKTERDLLSQLIDALAGQRATLVATLAELQACENLLTETDERAMLGRLAAGVTHDVRNHLTALNVLVDGIVECTEDAEAHAIAERALEGMTGIMTLIRGIDMFARRAGLEVQRETVATRALVASAVGLFALGSEHSSEIDVQIDPAAEVLSVDPNRIRQALLAILRRTASPQSGMSVAVTALPDGAVTVRVTSATSVTSRADATHIRAPSMELDVEVARLIAASHGGSLLLDAEAGGAGWASLTFAKAI